MNIEYSEFAGFLRQWSISDPGTWKLPVAACWRWLVLPYRLVLVLPVLQSIYSELPSIKAFAFLASLSDPIQGLTLKVNIAYTCGISIFWS